MNKATVAQQAKTAGSLPSTQGMLQRKCSCGNHTVGVEVESARSAQRKKTVYNGSSPLEQVMIRWNMRPIGWLIR